ncbi:MAG: cytochrome-c oxidase, cbb3-type subunit III [Parvibaculaceae bacterium]
MDIGRRDPITGRLTTGHEWNGIEELETPVPRVVLAFLAITILFAIGYWIAMPAWPLGSTYTRGLLGIDQRDIVTRQVEAARLARGAWMDRIGAQDLAALKADPVIMRHVREAGRTLFTDNCAACHGVSATGGPGFPDLTAKAWLWGGAPEMLAQTISIGINSTNDDTRTSQMMGFGSTGALEPRQVAQVAAYVRSLSGAAGEEGGDAGTLAAGQEIFKANCVSCHGDDARGKQDVGAPDLTDRTWIYGGDLESVYRTVYSGRQGHMPHWKGRLSPAEIKLLALYVDDLGTAP